ncbi:hypothetical protein LTR78_008228 [Recurvomyces mirabilis]|uniref:Uncharacterized protein n=1 Tax=Recurvomyces mirabilis TaxID=574656 RepID=A0AAE0TRA9_9PEZI|nr:hypothetical protein LTR78_008228 [Recurvomyces mirabilis]KAK5156513.1 hypothetical protein LTS14_004725 [Recurvomyces mirabilis]
MADKEPTRLDRTVYVVIPPSPLLAAHWSLLIPDPPLNTATIQQENNVGRRIHVAGDRLHGFQLEIVRGYDVRKHRGVNSRRFALGLVPEHFLSGIQSTLKPAAAKSKDEDEGGGYVDNSPIDQLERTCILVAPPGPSLVHVQAGGKGAARPKQTEVKDCQWWVKQVVELMFSKGMLVTSRTNDDGSEASSFTAEANLPVH